MDIKQYLPEGSLLRPWLTTWDHTEPPRSFLLLSAMATLGAIMGRSIWYNHDGNLRLYPMLNLLLIGKSGIGKTTALEPAFKGILMATPSINRPQMIVGAATPEKLHMDLRGNPKTLIVASELAAFFSKAKYMEQLIPYVTRLLDYAPYIERRTMAGDLVKVPEPAVTVLGASTKEWLSDQLPHSANEGGFLARFLILSEEHKAKKVASPAETVGPFRLGQIVEERRILEIEMALWAVACKGQINYRNQQAIDWYDKWYNGHDAPSGYLSPFASRAGEFVRRLAMLSAISCKRFEMAIEDIECGIQLYLYATKNLQKIVVPFSLQGKWQNAIVESCAECPQSDVSIRRQMLSFMTSLEADRLVGSLLQARRIEKHDDGLYHLVV